MIPRRVSGGLILSYALKSESEQHKPPISGLTSEELDEISSAANDLLNLDLKYREVFTRGAFVIRDGSGAWVF